MWVKIPSHVGIEGNTHPDWLAIAGRLANLLYPWQQHGTQRCEQRGEPLPKRRKVEHEPPPHQTGVLLEWDAATLLRSLGLELMSERSLGLDEACNVTNDTDTPSESSSDTASMCSNCYSFE